MSKRTKSPKDDRLVVCGGCGREFHLRPQFRGCVECARCFQCTEWAAQQMGVETSELREQMRSIRRREDLPFGWAPSHWAHERVMA